MVMKDNGCKRKRKSHKIRTYKCLCGEKVNIDERIQLEDYELVGQDKYIFYCPKCGDSSDIIKL